MSRRPAIKKKSSFGEDGKREDDDRHVNFGKDKTDIIFPTDTDAIEDAILKQKHFRSIMKRKHDEEEAKKNALIRQGRLRLAKRGKKLQRRPSSPILDMVEEEAKKEDQPSGCKGNVCIVQLRL